MLGLEESLNHAFASAGQFILDFNDVGITDLRIAEDIWVPAIYEYSQYRPIKRTIFQERATSVDVDLPEDAIGVLDVRERDFPGFTTIFTPDRRLPTTLWDIVNRKLRAGATLFDLQFITGYTVKNNFTDFDPGLTGSSTTAVFLLAKDPKAIISKPIKPLLETLKITVNNDPTPLVATSDAEGLISGDFTGTLDLNTFEVDLLFSSSEDLSLITVDYQTASPYVLEFGVEDYIFLKLFTARLLTSFGHLKAILTLEELPVDVNLDQLLDFGNNLKEEIEVFFESKRKWWLF